MELIKFFTAGNVDDGKSTLIGRLLLDSNSLSTDIIDTLTKQSKIKNNNSIGIDLALITDGLRAEREQGITIDVAYKFFSSEKRKFIIADTPGHFQYTRNMFTGASNTDIAILLIDARIGITEQTRRHCIISSMLRIPYIVLCVNKMDLISNDKIQYEKIVNDFTDFCESLKSYGSFEKIISIPTSAVNGDNVVFRSKNINWYEGPTLFEFLNSVEIKKSEINKDSRFQVQYVIRPQTNEYHDYRGYAGEVLSGNFKVGQEVIVCPDENITQIKKIEYNQQPISLAQEGYPVVLHLEDNIDVSRGSTIIPLGEENILNNNFNAIICWLDNTSFHSEHNLLLQQGSFVTQAIIQNILSKIDINTNNEIKHEENIRLNDFCKVNIITADSFHHDLYIKNKKTGSFILINENSNNTVAAGIII